MTEKKLSEQTCVPCKGGVPPLTPTQIEPLLKELDSAWSVPQSHHLFRSFRFKNFKEALAFLNKVGGLAEEQKHHPDFALSWGRVDISLWTHKIEGLTESDFILAAKIDQIE